MKLGLSWFVHCPGLLDLGFRYTFRFGNPLPARILVAWGLTNKGSGFRVTMGLTLGPAVRPKLRKKEKRIVAEMEDWGHIKFWPLDLGPRIAAPHVPASSWRIGVSYLYHSLSFYIHLKSLQKSPPQKQMPLYHILSIHYHYHTLLTILYHCFCLKSYRSQHSWS